MKVRETVFLVDPIPRTPVSQPDISPNGRRILFTYTTLNKEKDKYDSHVWVAPVDGGRPRQFTYGGGDDSHPLWSPDGGNIVFLSNRGEACVRKDRGRRLWVMPSEGGEARLLASIPGGIVGGKFYPPPSWSPDGGRVMFLARTGVERDSESASDVKIIRKLGYKGDGVGFFPDTRVHLFTVGKEGGDARQLTEGDFDVAAASWSPDGKKVAFMANMTEESDYTPLKDIWVAPSRGGRPERVREAVVARGVPYMAWSPDGRHLAYTSMDPVDHERLRHRYTNLWVMPSHGGEASNLTEAFDRPVARDANARIVWTPDSEALYFLAPSYGCSHIYKAALGERAVEKVTEGRMMAQSFSLSGDGSRIAFTATEATCPTEIWVHDTEGSRRITGLTNGLVKELPLIEPDEFWFTASDGADVQGWIMKPAGYEEGVRYPAVLQIHGGPWANYGYNFDLLFQLLSGNGYSVVFVNHRASTGYGEAFADITGRWGDREYMDLMEAVDHVVKNYQFVDPDRVGVGGCSGGGYLTNWIVTHTDRFKAAITVASISNWYSFYGCSDLGPCHILNFWDLAMGVEPWEDPEAYLKPSPIRYVENMNTPLLIIHGEEDLRCPIEQAEQLYAALKKLKKTVEFIRLPGEAHANVHGMKKPSHTTKALKHTIRWYDRRLKRA